MLTMREARQRNTLNRVCMERVDGGCEFMVTLIEWTAAQISRAAYFTDDLEDAVLTGAMMRRNTAKKTQCA